MNLKLETDFHEGAMNDLNLEPYSASDAARPKRSKRPKRASDLVFDEMDRLIGKWKKIEIKRKLLDAEDEENRKRFLEVLEMSATVSADSSIAETRKSLEVLGRPKRCNVRGLTNHSNTVPDAIRLVFAKETERSNLTTHEIVLAVQALRPNTPKERVYSTLTAMRKRGEIGRQGISNRYFPVNGA